METYEEKRARERQTLDEKFKAQSATLADLLVQEIEKAAGIAPKKSIHETGHDIHLWIDEPRISITIEHDWGTGRWHHHNLPLGTAKISLHLGGYGRGHKSWYRPNKEGVFNIEKMMTGIAREVEAYKRGQEASKKREIEDQENKAAQAKEMEGMTLPDGVIVNRIPGGNYGVKFAGTFIVGGAKDVAALADALNQLISKFQFQKSWRTDF